MVLQRYAASAACGLALASLAACGSDQHATDPTTATHSTTASAASPSSTAPSAGAYPTYGPTDYTYRLSVVCYCPVVGGVDVTVKGGTVASATLATGPDKGRAAPTYARKTINDIIAIANDPRSGHVEVVWPKGAPAPKRVTVNPLRRTADAQVSYVISRISAG